MPNNSGSYRKNTYIVLGETPLIYYNKDTVLTDEFGITYGPWTRIEFDDSQKVEAINLWNAGKIMTEAEYFAHVGATQA